MNLLWKRPGRGRLDGYLSSTAKLPVVRIRQVDGGRWYVQSQLPGGTGEMFSTIEAAQQEGEAQVCLGFRLAELPVHLNERQEALAETARRKWEVAQAAGLVANIHARLDRPAKGRAA